MGTVPAIRVDDDFAPSQSRVAMRSANNKLACGVDQNVLFAVEQSLKFSRQLRLDPWQQDVPHIILDACQHAPVGFELLVTPGP